MRELINEQQAEWKPSDTVDCHLKEFSKEDSCQILSKTVNKLIFMGKLILSLIIGFRQELSKISPYKLWYFLRHFHS